MKNDLISIIVPVYNVENYVKKTIESILLQTYSNIEIICVDDGSADKSLQIIKELSASDSRVKVFSKKNEGVTIARKYGVEQAQGEYIGFVDADDVIEPNMFERLYRNLRKYDVDISHCGHDIVWLDGRKESFYNTGRLAQQDKISGIKSLISGSFEPGLWNKLYKHNLLHSLFHSGVMDYSIKINEDLLMNYYLFKEAEKTVLEDVCLYHYIKREGSASTSALNQNHIWDQINVKKIILADSYETEYYEDAQRAYLMKCIHAYNSILKSESTEFEEDKRQISILLKNEHKHFSLLDKKYKLLAKLLISSPKLYSKVYKSFS